MFTFSSFGMNVYDTVLSCKFFYIEVPPERELVLKESSAGLYSLGVYYWCRCLVELPIAICSLLLSSVIVYFFAQLEM